MTNPTTASPVTRSGIDPVDKEKAHTALRVAYTLVPNHHMEDLDAYISHLEASQPNAVSITPPACKENDDKLAKALGEAREHLRAGDDVISALQVIDLALSRQTPVPPQHPVTLCDNCESTDVERGQYNCRTCLDGGIGKRVDAHIPTSGAE